MPKAKKKINMRQGTQRHRIYEAMATHPSTFTAFEIYRQTLKEYPKTTLSHVQTIISKFAQIDLVKKSGSKKQSKGHDRKTTLWKWNERAPQPVINRPVERRQPSAHKVRPDKEALPAEVDALTLGEAIIDYVKSLESKVADLARDLIQVRGKSDTQENALKREVQSLRYQLDGQKKANQDLRGQVNKARKSFKMNPVIQFKKEKQKGSR